jgi:MYXO-CTERM domain-containing protein
MHRFNSFILALAVAFTLSTQAYAQAPDTRRDAPPRADRSDDRDWGWLGLLGLAGLLGLMRRERAPAVRDRVATGTPR